MYNLHDEINEVFLLKTVPKGRKERNIKKCK